MNQSLFIDINNIAARRATDLREKGRRLFNSIPQAAADLAQTLFPKQPDKFVPINDPKAQMTRAFKTLSIDPTGMVGLTKQVGAKAAGPIFKGFTDLSTKLLEKLKGRTTIAPLGLANVPNTTNNEKRFKSTPVDRGSLFINK